MLEPKPYRVDWCRIWKNSSSTSRVKIKSKQKHKDRQEKYNPLFVLDDTKQLAWVTHILIHTACAHCLFFYDMMHFPQIFFLLPFIDCLIFAKRGFICEPLCVDDKWNKNWSLQGINCLVAVKSGYDMHHVYQLSPDDVHIWIGHRLVLWSKRRGEIHQY